MTKPDDVDSYIANAPPGARPIFVKLREIIHSVIPEAEEGISYNVPFYKFSGVHVGFAAFKNHATFGIGAEVLQDQNRKKLNEKGYKTGKETIQIKYGQKVPATMIEQLLKAKVDKAKND